MLETIVGEDYFDSPIETKMKKKMKDIYVSINEILDDICTNTLALASTRLNFGEWKEKEALYDLGIIYKQQ